MDIENNNSIEFNDNEEIFTIVEDEVQKMTFIQRLASLFVLLPCFISFKISLI